MARGTMNGILAAGPGRGPYRLRHSGCILTLSRADGVSEQISSVEPEPGFWASVWEALRGSQRDFTSGSIPRAVFLLAVPMMLELVGESIFAVADAFFVSRLGAAPLAAVGLTEALLALVYSIAIGLSMATTALVARRWGERREADAGRAAAQAILAGVAISVVLGLAGALAAPSLLRLMGAEPEVVVEGANYTRIMTGGMVTIMLLFLINAAFRGAGDASIAMRSLWLANAVNLALDPCLIFGLGPFPELGLTGAAVATNLGRGTGVVYQLWTLTRRSKRLHSGAADFRPDVPVIRNLMRVSWGGIGQYLVATASWIGLIRILAVFGSTMLTAYFGLLDVGQPQSGETVLVSGAAGATGSMVAQLARLQGCRVVGIAGGEEKCQWLRDACKVEDVIDYKSEDITRRIGELCPGGVNVFFDNVGGDTLEAGLEHMADYGRIVLCGAIAGYNDTVPSPGPSNLTHIITRRLRMQGFIVIDYLDRAQEAFDAVGEWVAAGEIAWREDIQAGFENIPSTLQRLFDGSNRGKQLLKLADPE